MRIGDTTCRALYDCRPPAFTQHITCYAITGYAVPSRLPNLYTGILQEQSISSAIPRKNCPALLALTHAIHHTRLQPLPPVPVNIHHTTPTDSRKHRERHLRRRDGTWVRRGGSQGRQRSGERVEWRVAKEGGGGC